MTPNQTSVAIIEIEPENHKKALREKEKIERVYGLMKR